MAAEACVKAARSAAGVAVVPEGHRVIQCPTCGRFSARAWSLRMDWYVAWGGTCSTHGEWSDSE